MTADDRGTALVVFAKAPQPGAVKSRLIALLGAEGAAALHARLVRHALATARASALHPVELHCAPDTGDPFFRSCETQFGVALRPQAGGDLGQRMLASLESALAGRGRALLIGSDCPALTPQLLREAAQRLNAGADAVFAPCEDGGYALVGVRRAEAALFEGIAWGTATVMAETRERLRQLGWTWRELETLWDVDRPEDVARLNEAALL